MQQKSKLQTPLKKIKTTRSSLKKHDDFDLNKPYIIIDIDKFIHDDILKKYNDVYKMYKQEASTRLDKEKNENFKSILREKEEFLAEACEIFLWSQQQQKLNKKPISFIELENKIFNPQEHITMLHYISRTNCLSILTLLLQNQKIDQNVQTKYGCMPIHYAICTAQNETVSWLLDHGAINYTKRTKAYPYYTPMYYALCLSNNESIQDIFINKHFGQKKYKKNIKKSLSENSHQNIFNPAIKVSIDPEQTPITLAQEIDVDFFMQGLLKTKQELNPEEKKSNIQNSITKNKDSKTTRTMLLPIKENQEIEMTILKSYIDSINA